MKKLLIALALMVPLALPVAITGCKAASSTTSTQALAPGYLNQADQAMGQTLVGAHTFYATIQQDVANEKYTPSSTEKTALNNFATALNAAQLIYIGYHAGVNTQTQAQTAVNSVMAQQTAIQASLTRGK